MTLQEALVQLKLVQDALAQLIASQAQYTQEQLDAALADANAKILDLEAKLEAAAKTPVETPVVVDVEALKAAAAAAAVAAYKASVVEKLKAVRKDDDALLASLEEVPAPAAPVETPVVEAPVEAPVETPVVETPVEPTPAT